MVKYIVIETDVGYMYVARRYIGVRPIQRRIERVTSKIYSNLNFLAVTKLS